MTAGSSLVASGAAPDEAPLVKRRSVDFQDPEEVPLINVVPAVPVGSVRACLNSCVHHPLALIFWWYFFATLSTLCNKQIMHVFPYPIIISTIQIATAFAFDIALIRYVATPGASHVPFILTVKAPIRVQAGIEEPIHCKLFLSNVRC